MSTKVTNTDRYPATPVQIMTMLRDPAYPPAKYEALGDIKFEVKTHEVQDNNGLNTVVDREVSANLPDLAKKVLGDTNHMVQKEVWRADGDAFVADLEIDSPGKPIAITGDMRIEPVGDSESDWSVTFDIKASVPFVGGKIEKIVANETKDNLTKEFAFNKEWLASH